jgi:hypothetical protein
MKKKPKIKYEIIHRFYEKLEKMIDDLEKQTGKVLEIQINIKK